MSDRNLYVQPAKFLHGQALLLINTCSSLLWYKTNLTHLSMVYTLIDHRNDAIKCPKLCSETTRLFHLSFEHFLKFNLFSDSICFRQNYSVICTNVRRETYHLNSSTCLTYHSLIKNDVNVPLHTSLGIKCIL